MRIQNKFTSEIIEKYGYHFVFILTLAGLIVIGTYWSFELRENLRTEQSRELRSISFNIQYFKKTLTETRPEKGIFSYDNRLEIADYEAPSTRLNSRLLPPNENLALRVRDSYMEELEEKYEFRNIKITGESLMLALFLIINIYMFYRLLLEERKSTSQLKQIWRRLGHEVITPTTGFKTLIDTLESVNLSRKEMKPLLKLARKEIGRQELIAENLIAGQMISAPAGELNMQNINIATFIDRYLKNKPVLDELAEINFTPDDEDITVHAFSDGLYAVLNNLVQNSIKHCDRKPEINIEVSCSKRQCLLDYRDDGPGIPDGVVRNLFAGYKLGDKASGAGIGLMVSRMMARKMGGELEFIKDSGESGSHFRLTLKRVKVS